MIYLNTNDSGMTCNNTTNYLQSTLINMNEYISCYCFQSSWLSRGAFDTQVANYCDCDHTIGFPKAEMLKAYLDVVQCQNHCHPRCHLVQSPPVVSASGQVLHAASVDHVALKTIFHILNL